MIKANLQRIQSQLKSGQLTVVDLAKQYLQRIEATRELNIYIDVYENEIIAKAEALDQRIKAEGELGRCFGMIISVKDVICEMGKKVTAASALLEGFTSIYTATALERLLAEDALVIGKVNCDQFGMGSSNENSCYGPTKNADDPERIPGGSSGASAVSVQANTCLIALGSDTGGSVRQPAGFTGVIGLKPTYGRVSRYGLIAYGSSFDQIGVLGHHTEDIALTMEIIAGADELDPTASEDPVPAYSKLSKFEKFKIAYFPKAMNHKGLDPEIKLSHEQLIEQLKSEGHQIEAVDFDLMDYVVPAYYTLTTAEASTNLARYDGVRYGKKIKDRHDLMAEMIATRTGGFSQEVKRRIMLGTFVLRSGYYDAYYGKAQKIRRLLKDQITAIFSENDFILLPISPVPAWKLGSKNSDPTEMYLADIYTVLANLAGVPALAMPLDRHSNGTRFGFQLLAGDLQEAKLFNFAHHFLTKKG